jgi:hypothetical protein
MDYWLDISLETLENEIWKDIPGYEGLYQASTLGRIKCLKRERINSRNPNYTLFLKEKIKKQSFNKLLGYLYITLTDRNKKPSSKRVHRLIAETFINNLENKLEVNHIDNNKLNNSVDNLEWCTALENTRHLFKTGHPAKRIKLSFDKIQEIKDFYKNNNLSYKKVGELYGVKEKAIMRLVLGQTWNF